mgnify:CR=1 FL=1
MFSQFTLHLIHELRFNLKTGDRNAKKRSV